MYELISEYDWVVIAVLIIYVILRHGQTMFWPSKYRSNEPANMLITPYDALKALGFNFPEEGIVINEHDRFLHLHSLHLIGKTISIDKISEDELQELRDGLYKYVRSQNIEIPTPENTDNKMKLRALIKANSQVLYKYSKGG